DVLAVRQLLERAGDLVDLLHACARRPAADEYDHISGADVAGLDGLNGSFLGDENPRRPAVAIDVLVIDERGVDGCALDDRALRRKIADGKADGRGKTARAGA